MTTLAKTRGNLPLEMPVNKQALLDVVRALDFGATDTDFLRAFDILRLSFSVDEITSGQASLTHYDGAPEA